MFCDRVSTYFVNIYGLGWPLHGIYSESKFRRADFGELIVQLVSGRPKLQSANCLKCMIHNGLLRHCENFLNLFPCGVEGLHRHGKFTRERRPATRGKCPRQRSLAIFGLMFLARTNFGRPKFNGQSNGLGDESHYRFFHDGDSSIVGLFPRQLAGNSCAVHVSWCRFWSGVRSLAACQIDGRYVSVRIQ